MNDVGLPELVRALELFAVERKTDSSFVAITPSPAWLPPIIEAAGPGPVTFAQAFPFLDGFLRDAEAFWVEAGECRLISGLFTATSGSSDLLLRASALNLGSRCVIVLESLVGDADARPLLQTARENKLEYERLVRQVESIRGSLTAISESVRALLATDLTDAQRPVAERIELVCTDAQHVATGERPPGRERRPRCR